MNHLANWDKVYKWITYPIIMGINISAWGTGLAAILGTGAVILVILGNPA